MPDFLSFIYILLLLQLFIPMIQKRLLESFRH